MPFLAVTHLREVRCRTCGALLAQPGARSFVVDADGLPVGFEENAMPEELAVDLQCPAGHAARVLVPNEAAVEDVETIPEAAPIGVDARLMEL